MEYYNSRLSKNNATKGNRGTKQREREMTKRNKWTKRKKKKNENS
jgi:hypothetical protein